MRIPCLFYFVSSCDLQHQSLKHGFQNPLGVILPVGIFHDHQFKKRAYGMIFCNGQVDELIRKFVGLRFDEKTEQCRIRIYRGQILMKERILANQNADYGHFLVAVRSQGVSAVRLADIAFILVNCDQIVVFFG